MVLIISVLLLYRIEKMKKKGLSHVQDCAMFLQIIRLLEN